MEKVRDQNFSHRSTCSDSKFTSDRRQPGLNAAAAFTALLVFSPLRNYLLASGSFDRLNAHCHAVEAVLKVGQTFLSARCVVTNCHAEEAARLTKHLLRHRTMPEGLA